MISVSIGFRPPYAATLFVADWKPRHGGGDRARECILVVAHLAIWRCVTGDRKQPDIVETQQTA